MANKPCHYEVLGLDRSAKANEVKRAYKKLALNWHPDKNPNNRQEATEMFRLIAEAYDVLGDPEKRRLYDAYGHAGVEVGGDPRGAHGGGTAAAAAAAAHGGEWGNSGDPFQGGTFRDPFEMFEAFFGASSANGAFGRVGGLFGRPTSMRDFSREPAFGHRDEVYPEHGGGRAAGRRNDRDFFGGDPFFRSNSMGHDMFREFDGFMNNGFGGGSGFGGMGGGGGGFSSFSSTTIGPDGVPQTFSRTERVVLNPDGTHESKVEEFVDGVPVPVSGGSIPPGHVQHIDNTPNVSSGRRGSRTGRNISRLFGGRPNW